MKRLAFFLVIFFICLPLLLADFGVVIGEGLLFEHDGESGFAYKTSINPWLALPLGKADFYLSMGISANYDKTFIFVPELQRLELSLRPLERFGIRAGRFPWEDSSGLTAKGFFDGAELLFDIGQVRLGAAALYTGFLYKDTAIINNSPGDPKDYTVDFDWADFENTYFAPSRLLASLYGEFPGLPYGRGNIYAGLLAQFDLGDSNEAFDTQYLLLRYVFFYHRFDLAVSGVMQLENTQAGDFRTAYASSIEAGLSTGLLDDRISLGLRWASGDGPDTAAFFPLIREAQGLVLKPILSGIMVLRASYLARLLPSLSAELGGRYFLRTDSGSFADPYLEHSSYLLGAELDAAVFWVPYSDISFSLEGGVFLPQTGEAFADNAAPRWSFGIGAIFSF